MTYKEPEQQLSVRLSNRAYGQLRAILAAPHRVLTLEQISTFNQLVLGGNRRRGFVVETRNRRGLTITDEGRAAIRSFDTAEFYRKVATMNFSSFLKLDAYGVARKPVSKKAGRQHVTDIGRHRKVA